MFGRVVKAFNTWRLRRSMPLRLEFNLIQDCNLNCCGCTHYSPLAKDTAEPLDKLEAALRHFGSFCDGKIGSIALIGGEPLLYSHLTEAIALARKYFPTTPIHLFTNGILLPKMSDAFWETCSSNDIELSITRYPIKMDYAAIDALCKRKGVRTDLFADRTEDNTFFRFPLDPTRSQNKWLAHFRCYSFGCLTVRGDRLFPCSQAGCIDILNKRFNTDFKLTDRDYFHIKDVTSLAQIRRLRNRPIPFCRYCRHAEDTNYKPSHREASEWID